MKPLDILVKHDDWLLYKDEKAYNNRWKARCENCLSVCCFFKVVGAKMNYNDEMKIFDQAKDFWNHNFVIMKISNQTWDENIEMGFNITLNPQELAFDSGLLLCPLAINGRCWIYKDRPKLCKIFKCRLGTNKFLGVN